MPRPKAMPYPSQALPTSHLNLTGLAWPVTQTRPVTHLGDNIPIRYVPWASRVLAQIRNQTENKGFSQYLDNVHHFHDIYSTAANITILKLPNKCPDYPGDTVDVMSERRLPRLHCNQTYLSGWIFRWIRKFLLCERHLDMTYKVLKARRINTRIRSFRQLNNTDKNFV